MLSTKTIQDCGKFDVTLLSTVDWDMWLRLSQLGQAGFTNDIGMIYLMRPNSESRNYYLRIQYMKKYSTNTEVIFRHITLDICYQLMVAWPVPMPNTTCMRTNQQKHYCHIY